MPVQGVGLKTDRDASQEEMAVPKVYTSTHAWAQPPTPPFPP